MKNRGLLILALATLMLLPAGADAGDWILRGRAIKVSPDGASSEILDTGTTVTVDDDTVLEIDITYMFNNIWGVEVIAAVSSHDLATKGGTLGGANAGEVAALPPTVTLQYHMGFPQDFDLYLGVGFNYTIFYDYDLSDDLAALGVRDLDFDDSLGFAAQIGLDITASEHWIVNLDAKYIDMSTDVEMLLEDGGVLDTLTVDVDPWVFGFGIGYRF